MLGVPYCKICMCWAFCEDEAVIAAGSRAWFCIVCDGRPTGCASTDSLMKILDDNTESAISKRKGHPHWLAVYKRRKSSI